MYVVLIFMSLAQEQLVEWKEIFGRHGLRVRLEKTEVLWVGQQKKDLDIIIIIKFISTTLTVNIQTQVEKVEKEQEKA